ncbi:hypothetical protein Dd1591_0097 [Dickeya chrysanthemi Ech1591]|uniref:Uncharacterized protein n=1 Tax=Dickeya chrysanthemi (strain Ech1591) TaxID=561229 RepID=C6CG07_DICC1|nr:hypothetical protein [Dickeya chrysanthemi]ACT04990.1 hypothetical protein Dd1591_0097 [Dickeya chrysanthemi Ech1591]
MTLCIQPDDLVWRTFAPENDAVLPAPHPNQDLMADYLRAFFRSHGEIEEPDNALLTRWLNSGRYSFSTMMQTLLPELQARGTLQQLDLVVFAHWTPDSDLGCAVSNALIHACDARHAFGLSVSDRGLAAPLFALHTIDDYLACDDNRREALLMIADQDVAPYPSEQLTQAHPQKNCCLIRMEKRPADEAIGLVFEGYYRQPYADQGDLAATLRQLLSRLPITDALPLTLLARPSLVTALQGAFPELRLANVPPSLLCAAPFVYLKQHAEPGQRYLLAVPERRHLTVCVLRYQPHDARPRPLLPSCT